MGDDADLVRLRIASRRYGATSFAWLANPKLTRRWARFQRDGLPSHSSRVDRQGHGDGLPAEARAAARAKDGGPDRDRTGDLMNAIHARSQLRYRPTLGERRTLIVSRHRWLSRNARRASTNPADPDRIFRLPRARTRRGDRTCGRRPDSWYTLTPTSPGLRARSASTSGIASSISTS